jgi:hypothetical protein
LSVQLKDKQEIIDLLRGKKGDEGSEEEREEDTQQA